jgi:phosphonopyruvate decarboxylase
MTAPKSPEPKLDPRVLLQALVEGGFADWVGVPDSTLEPLMQLLPGQAGMRNLIATNECEAASIALGQFLGSGRPTLVYLQNSGFGKTIHPITSLFAREVCRIPLLLLIGWRGAPDAKADEPQHRQMGRIMPAVLNAIEVPHAVLSPDPARLAEQIRAASKHLAEEGSPYALVVRPDLLAGAERKVSRSSSYELTRRDVLLALTGALPREAVFLSTTGKASRELFFIREEAGESHQRDFHVVGGMGCASSIALGVARKQAGRLVCAVDGDGAALMQLGSFATIGQSGARNLLHVLVDNECHDSTGGQPTVSPGVDFVAVARACGYAWAKLARTREELRALLGEAVVQAGPRLLVVKARPGSDPKLGRPSEPPSENAAGFRRNLGV